MMSASFALVVALAMLDPSDSPPKIESTLGARPPEGAIVLFDGKSLASWVQADGKTPARWPVSDGILTVGKGQGSIMTTQRLGDVQMHVEFNVPYMPDARGQARGNSGVYLAGAYELQILDSYGLKLQNNDCGAIYKQVVPLVNACKPPLQWQTYDITFHKAKRDGDKTVKKATITVYQNGIKIIDNAEISPTPGGVDTPEGSDGPLLLQDHGNDVQFRNMWAKSL
ncbi:MAG: DUF1080 domain-containing protein [Isosphaeraceae bacterium]